MCWTLYKAQQQLTAFGDEFGVRSLSSTVVGGTRMGGGGPTYEAGQLNPLRLSRTASV